MCFLHLALCMVLLPEWNAFKPGIGMSFTMVWSDMILGIMIGLIGILLLLSLIPIIKGLK